MKKLEIITRTHMLDAVKDALAAVGVQGMTVSDARGFGRQRGHKEVYRGAEYQVDLLPKIRIEAVVDDGIVEEAVRAASEAARTGQVGDGKVFVTTVDEVVRIRTGETGPQAL